MYFQVRKFARPTGTLITGSLKDRRGKTQPVYRWWGTRWFRVQISNDELFWRLVQSIQEAAMDGLRWRIPRRQLRQILVPSLWSIFSLPKSGLPGRLCWKELAKIKVKSSGQFWSNYSARRLLKGTLVPYKNNFGCFWKVQWSMRKYPKLKTEQNIFKWSLQFLALTLGARPWAAKL